MADEQIVDTDKPVDQTGPVTEDDLRALKYGGTDVETGKTADETDETEEDQETEEETEDDESPIGADDVEEDEAPAKSFTKQFPNIKGDTPEEYAKNLETAYQNSTAEAMRLKKPAPDTENKEDAPEIDTSDISSLYAKQQMDKAITEAWTDFQKQYTQTTDQTEYNKFTQVVQQLSNTILQSEKRLADPSELYRKAAVILDWQPEAPTKEDKLKMAVKDGAASTRTSGSAKRTAPSKVTEAMLALNRKWYPNKSDAEIRKELEPFIQ